LHYTGNQQEKEWVLYCLTHGQKSTAEKLRQRVVIYMANIIINLSRGILSNYVKQKSSTMLSRKKRESRSFAGIARLSNLLKISVSRFSGYFCGLRGNTFCKSY
jgi:hypothetical protein